MVFFTDNQSDMGSWSRLHCRVQHVDVDGVGVDVMLEGGGVGGKRGQ